MFRRIFLVFLIGLTASPLTAAPAVSFEADVRPILKAYCFECHGEGEKLRGALDLRLAKLLRKGGDSGPGLIPGKPDQSILLERIRSGAMPPGKKKLGNDQVDTLRRWILAGAPVAEAEPETLAIGLHLTADDRAWWAFQPVRRAAIPGTVPGDSVRNAVDAFLLARLHKEGLRFNPEADRTALIRRLYFDLVGLPPAPEEVADFVASRDPDAYERLVERLLASPRYGERWARHWLDVAGYADSEGYAVEDAVRATAWKYRDYVVRAFNSDKPFDRFIHEQLAGDEMLQPPYRNLAPDDLDKLVATGFLRMAPDGTGSVNVDQKLARNQVIGDTLKIVSTSLLGLTVSCAQCHNHRYDPIPQTDYYRLRALFEPAYNPVNWRTPAARQVSLATDTDRKQAAAFEAEAVAVERERLKQQEQFIRATFEVQLTKVPEAAREKVRAAWSAPEAKRTAEQKRLLQEHPQANVTAGSLYLYDSKAAAELAKQAGAAAALRAKKPVEEFVRALTEVPGQVPPTHLFRRGDPDQPGPIVAAGGLTILDDRLPLLAKDAPSGSTGRRTALARWLTDPRHPLTARVLVNRIWMHHFGRGLVATPADFGRLGEKPTHPELLDWLAEEFTRDWSLKRLHRLLVTSAAYRQSSRRSEEKDRLDPENRFLGRMPLRRLDAESVRDAILTIAGNRTDRMYGKPVPVKENEVGQFVLGIENKDGAGRFTAEVPLPAGDATRRSLYVQVRRSRPLGVLEAFDWALVEPVCEVRSSSTVAPQALLMMNSEFQLTQAERFAARVVAEVGDSPEARVSRTWQLAFGVAPNELELAGALRFVQDQTVLFAKVPLKDGKAPQQPALAVFCQVLLSANRFLYVD